MSESEIGRLSVSMIDVSPGREDDFLAIARDFTALVAGKAYGRSEFVRDEAVPLRFYAVRHWASTAAAEACHADLDVQSVTKRLYEIAQVTHVVNGVRKTEAPRLISQRRNGAETDRRGAALLMLGEQALTLGICVAVLVHQYLQHPTEQAGEILAGGQTAERGRT